jgi:hypothetical protein
VPQIALSVAVVEEEDERTRRMATDASKAEECLPADGTGFTKSQQYRYWDETILMSSPSFTSSLLHTISQKPGW